MAGQCRGISSVVVFRKREVIIKFDNPCLKRVELLFVTGESCVTANPRVWIKYCTHVEKSDQF